MSGNVYTDRVRRLVGSVTVALIISGCAAGDVLRERKFLEGTFLEGTFLAGDGTTLATAEFGPDVRYGIAVELDAGEENSMHAPVIEPLAQEVANMVSKQLGVNAVIIDHAGDWEPYLQRMDAATDGDDVRDAFFRERDFSGYALVTLKETTDRASRNQYDYSVRGRMNLVALEIDPEKGPVRSNLTRVALPQTVCSRVLRNQPQGAQIADIWSGYKLRNVPRCASRLLTPLNTEFEKEVAQSQRQREKLEAAAAAKAAAAPAAGTEG